MTNWREEFWVIVVLSSLALIFVIGPLTCNFIAADYKLVYQIEGFYYNHETGAKILLAGDGLAYYKPLRKDVFYSRYYYHGDDIVVITAIGSDNAILFKVKNNMLINETEDNEVFKKYSEGYSYDCNLHSLYKKFWGDNEIK